MVRNHWVDALSVALIRGGSRRGMLHMAGGLVVGYVLGDRSSAAAKGKKKRHKGNKNKDSKPKPKPARPQSCSGGVCAQQWEGDQFEINSCELTCRRCAGDSVLQFCILEGDPDNPAKFADCCEIPAPDCCNGKCTNFQDDKKNCKTCGNACADGQVCSGGECICRPELCPHGQLCFDNQCGCGPFYKYCPNLNGGVCASQNAVC